MIRYSLQAAGWALLLLATGGATVHAESWRAGVAKVSITPREPVWMAGFSSRTHPSEGVRLEIYAKALALEDENGKTAVLVTLDLCDISREMVAVIATKAERQFGLTRDRLAINVSHTHSGPLVMTSAVPGWYDLTPQQADVARRYTTQMLDHVVEAIGQSLKALSPASLAFEQGLAGIAVNRRRVQLRHLPGPVDQDVPVLSVRGIDGSLRAIVVGYACHATALNDYQISGDWPGFAQIEIEKAHPGAMALFVQGAGADANPLPRRTVELAQGFAQTLAAATDQVLNGKMKPLTGTLKTSFELVDVPFHPLPSREELLAGRQSRSVLVQRQYQRLLDILDRDGKLPDRYPYPVQIWRIGTGLKMVILGGEVVADYALRLKAQHGWTDTWVASYSNDVFAYIPSLRVLKEGGYEGRDSMLGDGHPAPFGAAIEEIIVEKVNDLMQQTGK